MYTNDEEVMTAALGFLESLLSGDCLRGSYSNSVDKILKAVYDTPGVIDEFERNLKNGPTAYRKELDAFCLMLVRLARVYTEIREDLTVQRIAELFDRNAEANLDPSRPQLQQSVQSQLVMLLLPQRSRAAALANDKQAAFAGANANLTLADLRNKFTTPGGRHDNDFVDFKDIKLPPTAAELNSTEAPYLPMPAGSQALLELGHPAAAEAALLDRHFRLMREDMLGPLREELQEELKSKPDKRKRLYESVRVVGIELKPRPCFLLEVQPTQGLKSRLEMTLKKAISKDKDKNKGKDKDKNGDTKEANKSNGPVNALKEFFEENGRRVLGRDTLVVLLTSDRKASGAGVIIVRESEKMAKAYVERKVVQVGVAFDDKLSMFLMGRFGTAAQTASFLFNSSASFFSYEPVLKGLQGMTRVPFDAEFVKKSIKAEIPEVPHGGKSLEDFSQDLQDKIGADVSQREAFNTAMQSRVTIIQGPPG